MKPTVFLPCLCHLRRTASLNGWNSCPTNRPKICLFFLTWSPLVTHFHRNTPLGPGLVWGECVVLSCTLYCNVSIGVFPKENNGVEGIGQVAQILEDADSLNSAGDPDAIANPPRSLRQFRLGWLPPSNWFRQIYEQEAQITVISIREDESPIQVTYAHSDTHRLRAFLSWPQRHLKESSLPSLTRMIN